MAGAVQWSIDQLWKGLQSLKNQISAIDAKLNQDKAELTTLYAWARQEYDPAGAYDRALLTPLIHQNSVLRLNYLKPLKDKFTQATNLASDALRRAGYTTPGLSGLGAVFVIAPAAAVTIVIVALAAVATVAVLTESQRNRTKAMLAVMQDASTSPAEKAALVKQMEEEIAKEPKLLLGQDVGWVVPALGVVAIIMLGPSLLKALPARRTAA